MLGRVYSRAIVELSHGCRLRAKSRSSLVFGPLVHEYETMPSIFLRSAPSARLLHHFQYKPIAVPLRSAF